MKKRITFAAIAIAISAQMAASTVDMMIGARGLGFGGAYVALVNDPSAAYWNPAALSRVESISLWNPTGFFRKWRPI